MKVKLLNYTSQPEKTVAIAGKRCYSSADNENLSQKINEEAVAKFIHKLISLGHHSALEHASFTFTAEGISRVTSHQLVRHRLASYSQQSQRYVKEDQFDYVIPPLINEQASLKNIFDNTMQELQKIYGQFLEAGILPEDARYVLPNATETKIIFTMNARELLHFFRLRCCLRSQWEIIQLADNMLAEVKKAAPNIFRNAGPACVHGPCPEGEMTCGKIQEVRMKYKEQ